MSFRHKGMHSVVMRAWIVAKIRQSIVCVFSPVYPLANANSLNCCSSALISVSKSHPGREGHLWTTPSTSSIYTCFHYITLGITIYRYLTIHRYPPIHSCSVFGEHLRIFSSIYLHAAMHMFKTGQILCYAERKLFNFCAIIYIPQDYAALDSITLLYTLLTLGVTLPSRVSLCV